MSISVRVQNEYDYFDLISDCDECVGGAFFSPNNHWISLLNNGEETIIV